MSAQTARRTLGWEPIAELANDVVVSLHCPVDEPTWFVHRGDGPAPLRGLDEVRALRDALDAILDEAASSRVPDAAEIPFETVQRAARELHRQRGGHPAGWNGHCLTAAKAVLRAAFGRCDRFEITADAVERAARELHVQRGGHPAGWNGHCLTAAKAVLVAAAGTSRQSEGDS